MRSRILNLIRLSNLYAISKLIDKPSYNDYSGGLGTQTLLPQTVKIGETVDFSSDAILAGVKTVFIFKTDGEKCHY